MSTTFGGILRPELTPQAQIMAKVLPQLMLAKQRQAAQAQVADKEDKLKWFRAQALSDYYNAQGKLGQDRLAEQKAGRLGREGQGKETLGIQGRELDLREKKFQQEVNPVEKPMTPAQQADADYKRDKTKYLNNKLKMQQKLLDEKIRANKAREALRSGKADINQWQFGMKLAEAQVKRADALKKRASFGMATQEDAQAAMRDALDTYNQLKGQKPSGMSQNDLIDLGRLDSMFGGGNEQPKQSGSPSITTEFKASNPNSSRDGAEKAMKDNSILSALSNGSKNEQKKKSNTPVDKERVKLLAFIEHAAAGRPIGDTDRFTNNQLLRIAQELARTAGRYEKPSVIEGRSGNLNMGSFDTPAIDIGHTPGSMLKNAHRSTQIGISALGKATSLRPYKG